MMVWTFNSWYRFAMANIRPKWIIKWLLRFLSYYDSLEIVIRRCVSVINNLKIPITYCVVNIGKLSDCDKNLFMALT